MTKFALSILALVLGSASVEAATITGLSGSSVVIAAPSSVTAQAPGNVSAVIAFTERENVLLASDLVVDGGVIAAGTRVDSHMILFNPIDESKMLLSIGYDFEFSQSILGTIGTQPSLVATHGLLGTVGATYGPLHGLEGDDVIMTGGGTRVTGILNAIQPGDWFRVITTTASLVETEVLSDPGPGPAPVPLPATGLMLALGLLGLAAAQRRG